MVNEDILTSLKNAVAKGETLESAMQTAVASGYNARDVQEAAQYIGAGVVHMEKTSQDRILTMPNEKKGFFSNMFSKKQTTPTQQSVQPQKPVEYKSQPPQLPTSPQYNTNMAQTPSQNMSFSSIPLPKQIQQPKPIIQPPKPRPIQIVKTMSQPMQQPPQKTQPLKLPQPTPQPYQNPPQKKPQKQSYAKEIILLIMLLILAAILIITFRYRNEIVAFFSG